MKKAIITGISRQGDAYLAEFLLANKVLSRLISDISYSDK